MLVETLTIKVDILGSEVHKNVLRCVYKIFSLKQSKRLVSVVVTGHTHRLYSHTP